MHYVLVGPGALGCLLASTAAQAIRDSDRFTILDYNSERASLLSNRGILYQEGEKQSSFAVKAVSDPDQLRPVDAILLCVKSYDIKSCLEICKPILGKDTLLIFMQNGIRHLACEEALSGATAAYGTTTEGATLMGPGHVRHAGRGMTHLGFLNPSSDYFNQVLSQTRDLFDRGGLKTALTSSILTKLWAKLFVNVGINALTATLGCKNGELLTISGAEERMHRAIDEATQIAQAKGIDILSDPFEVARTVCKNTAANVSSMLQDVRNNRKTEIGSINGAIVAFGEELGIETPENMLLIAQVKDIESNYQP